jgi:TRAP-type C4-dicarboxylate transport system substrate-binding protein
MILGFLLLFLPCGQAPAAALDLKIATIAPEGSAWMRAMRQGGAHISERTGGRVNLKFYAGGVMGNDKSVLRKIRVGQLHGGVFTAGGLEEVYPELGLYNLPLLFRSMDEVDYVRARLDQPLRDGLDRAGFVSFGFAEGGFALLMAGSPVRSLEDLKGKKVWVPEGDTVSYRGMESLGLAPVTLPISDVLTGLQAGLIDVIASSPIAAVAFQWHTRIKFVTTTPLTFLYATLAVDRRVFSELAPADQAVVRDVMEQIYRDLDRQNRSDNEGAAKAMATQGLEFVSPAPAEVERWRAKAGTLIQQLQAEGRYDPALFVRLQQLLVEYRNQAGGEAGKGGQ